ncbi:TetR family transcriptional regulator [Mycobacterium sp. MYCO198283]|uniref:TetR/AcrR family transcriptional regulator n=1 Tax=Mycobacterium sp. MYCO198283 TaxID=2883505 RepID=UPI001E4E6B3A|nr:TetR family transcriptional regulator [Mycobacterium sp. MYCO198283]MCG5433429.1 TetR family transcriptional regulator [Mycobacterium sp. MYCO198283]
MPTSAAGKRPGRPRGGSDSRDRILASARELFARNGIGKTSVRAIAADAGVDSALVHHYFGTKERLFAAAIDVDVDPGAVLTRLRAAPVDELGVVLPTLVLSLWDSEAGVGFVASLRSALAGEQIAMFRSFLRDVVVTELAARVDDPPGTGAIRAEFVASQILGIAVARHILQLEPMASLPVPAIVEMIAPNLQRYFTTELPAALLER